MRRVVWSVIQVGLGILLVSASPGTAAAQAGASQPRPDDSPSIRVGATLYTDYTYTERPESVDADGNSYHPSQFNVSRSYININGTLSHLVSFRLTPDITRETGNGSSANGSLTFRVKYAFAQVSLEDWMPPGSWVRLGIQHTPFVEWQEGVYRYRFQGTVFSEREGYLSSSDAGASLHYSAPYDYGEVHVGYDNGETYSRAETNDQKAFQVRGTLRPFPAATRALRGLRLTGFYDGDRYVKDGERRRVIGAVTYEHSRVNAGFEHLSTGDRTSARLAAADGSGYSIWATPQLTEEWEGLLRFDRLTPNDRIDARRRRNLAGIAYWPKMQGSVSTSLLIDVETVSVTGAAAAAPDQRRLAVHALVQF